MVGVWRKETGHVPRLVGLCGPAYEGFGPRGPSGKKSLTLPLLLPRSIVPSPGKASRLKSGECRGLRAPASIRFASWEEAVTTHSRRRALASAIQGILAP